MKRPWVSVVILNWNGKSFLEQFLPLVVARTPVWAELVVADNASSDDSLRYLSEFHPDVRVISISENLGFAGGYNAALKQIDADYYVLLNSDMEVSPGWIEPLIDLMESDPGIAACQPKIMSYLNRRLFEYAGASGGFLDRYGYPFCRGRLFNTLEEDSGQYDDTREVFWATGACMVVRATAFHAAEGFDEAFFAHMEEIDLCWRFRHAGYKIMILPGSVVWHIGGGTLPRSSARKTFLNFRNSLWMLAKNLPARMFLPTIIKRSILDMVAALAFLLKGHPTDCLAVFRAHAAFYATLPGMRKYCRNVPDEMPVLIYRRSIVVDYFLWAKKRFTSLNLH